MKKQIDFNNFIDEFNKHGMQDHFSSAGLMELYKYLVRCEEKTGIEIVCDVMNLCRQFEEHKSIDEYNKKYCKSYKDIRELLDKAYNFAKIPVGETGIIVTFY